MSCSLALLLASLLASLSVAAVSGSATCAADTHKMCGQWEEWCHNQGWWQWMSKHCGTTCCLKNVESGCRPDFRSRCSVWKKQCNSPTSKAWMGWFCGHTCCDVLRPVPNASEASTWEAKLKKDPGLAARCAPMGWCANGIFKKVPFGKINSHKKQQIFPCKQNTNSTTAGWLPCVTRQDYCTHDEGSGYLSNNGAAAKHHDRCETYFGNSSDSPTGSGMKIMTCPDGGIQRTGVFIANGPSYQHEHFPVWMKQFSNGTGMIGYCAAWNSREVIRGLLDCAKGGRTCTKMGVRKEKGMSESAGVFVFKRMVCDDKGVCRVYKVGQCFDVSKPVFLNCPRSDGPVWATNEILNHVKSTGSVGKGHPKGPYKGKGCLWTGANEYTAAKLEEDALTFANEVLKQMATENDRKRGPKPCSNIPTWFQGIAFNNASDLEIAQAAILSF